MRPAVVITSHSGRIGTAALGAAALALLVWDAVKAGLVEALLNAPFVALFVWCAWMFWGLASIRIDDDGVHVINQLRVWEVPWTRLEQVSGRWGLTLTTTPDPTAGAGSAKGRSVRAWAAPARGTGGRIARRAPEMPVIPEGAHEPMSVSLDAFSAARLIEIEQIQRRPKEDSGDRVAVRMNWPTIVITVVLVVLAVLA